MVLQFPDTSTGPREAGDRVTGPTVEEGLTRGTDLPLTGLVNTDIPPAPKSGGRGVPKTVTDGRPGVTEEDPEESDTSPQSKECVTRRARGPRRRPGSGRPTSRPERPSPRREDTRSEAVSRDTGSTQEGPRGEGSETTPASLVKIAGDWRPVSFGPGGGWWESPVQR